MPQIPGAHSQNMLFVSTRGQAPALSFSDTVLAGLATDGGLYVPESWPQISPEEIAGFAGKPYAEVAFRIISRFTGDEIPETVLFGMIEAAYGTFRHPSVAPLVELEPGHFLLELFHGPTLAFKDVAMQFLARLMDNVLQRRNLGATIIGATSGDTGSAAIEAFRGRETTDIFILHPEGKTSEVQRRQMTTVLDHNVHNVALAGNFDDCQNLVKALFNNHQFRDRVRLSGVNSINWGRIVAQIVYYFTAAVSLGAPQRPITFVVPTGNFGDIFAGFAAKRMGLPIKRLVIATNSNDILRRAIDGGRYDVEGVSSTMSPSMDIQVSSNFERLLFEAADRNPSVVRGAMQSLRQSGGFAVPTAALERIRSEFSAGTADERLTAVTIGQTWKRAAYLLDPHTAVAVAVAQHHLNDGGPVVTLSTAHPAKFPAAVRAASGVEPPLPAWLADLYGRPERLSVLPNEPTALEEFIEARTRAA